MKIITRSTTSIIAAIAAYLSVAIITNAPCFAGKQPLHVVRQYPMANAREVSPTTNIGLTAPIPYDRTRGLEHNYVLVSGSKTGVHAVGLQLSDDGRTLILHPAIPFAPNEQIVVEAKLLLTTGDELLSSFTFQTMKRVIDTRPFQVRFDEAAALAVMGADTAVPDSLPPMNVLVDSGGSEGTYYLANFAVGAPTQNFLFNLDQHGSIIRRKNLMHTVVVDFKMQPTGRITYFDYSHWKFVGVDSNWNVVDSFRSTNGYNSDQHELILLPNGGYALLAVSGTTLDSAQCRPGMVPGAFVLGNVIQIFDGSGNETFEWRGIDHYNVFDAIHEDLSDSSLDFEHANSLDIDSDGNLLLSNRHLSEITKIAGETGDILWRLGGIHNEFALRGDSIWFSYQHSVRFLQNGHIILFDNANFDSLIGTPGWIHHSRALEYEIDPVTKTATAVWQWHHTPETYTLAMGNVERLATGRTVIGWGWNFDASITEIDTSNRTVFELFIGPYNFSYRALFDPLGSHLGVPVNSQPKTAFHARFVQTANGGELRFLSPENSVVSIYDVLGREIGTSRNVEGREGEQSLAVATSQLTPGAYFCTLRNSTGETATAPFVVAR